MQQVLSLQAFLEAQVFTAVQRMLLKLNIPPLFTVLFKVSDQPMPLAFVHCLETSPLLSPKLFRNDTGSRVVLHHTFLDIPHRFHLLQDNVPHSCKKKRTILQMDPLVSHLH